MKQPRVEVLPIEQGATPDPTNVNKHTQRGGALLENSLRKRGAFRSIASAGKDAETPVVYAGNYTLEKAVDAGFTEIVNVHVTGHQLVNIVRDDIAPGSAEAIALGIEDNEIGKQSYNPDIDTLAALAVADNSILAELRKQDKVFDGLIEGMTPQQIDYEKEWEGMPEFKAEAKAYKSLMVHFENEEALNEFLGLINQEITERTKYIWHPKKTIQKQEYIFVNES